jgi:hypothetical protein
MDNHIRSNEYSMCEKLVIPFTEEEIQRAEKETDEYSLNEILAELSKQQRTHVGRIES